MKQDDFDVVVIGSGAGGGASAWALAENGIRVLVIEAGPAYDPFRDYLLDRPDWEQTRFPDRARHKARYTFGKMQSLDPGHDTLRSWNHVTGPMNTSERRSPADAGYHHVRGVGGSTLAFSGEAQRLNPASMKMKSRFGVATDWPFDYQELEPYYTIAEKVIGVAGPAGDSIRPRSKPFPLPPHSVSYAGTKVVAGGRKLGLHFVPNTLAILSRPYDNRPDCNYCAACNRGCPRADKGSVDVTFMRKVAASGYCAVLPDSVVTYVEAGPDDRVRAVLYADARGTVHRVQTRTLIVSCGAVETPRLLLASRSPNCPDGLANESGQVGRNFMELLSWVGSGIHPEPLASFRGVTADIICWDYNAPDRIPSVPGGCRFSTATAEADLLGPINYALRVAKGWGRAHRLEMKRVFGHALSVGSIGESLPNSRSFIDLDPASRDEFGIPRARINSFVDETGVHRLLFMAEKVREILKASGAEEIFEEYGTYDFFSSTHVFGTCRMGNDPGESVVNPFLRSHRWKNLFIADASVFPSSGGGESPSLTIEALAIRTAMHIRDLFGKGEL